MLTNEDTLRVFKSLLGKLRFGSEEREAVNNVIVLLERNTPKKTYFVYCGEYWCSICDNKVTKNEHYCPNCGQRLDWGLIE